MNQEGGDKEKGSNFKVSLNSESEDLNDFLQPLMFG